jgi:phage terminase large subunit-like protein
VHLLKNEWNEYFIKQFNEFPYGEKDDIIELIVTNDS